MRGVGPAHNGYLQGRAEVAQPNENWSKAGGGAFGTCVESSTNRSEGRRLIGRLALAVVLAWLAPMATVAAPSPAAEQGARTYDIAPQALEGALEAYGAASDVQVIYDSQLAVDRRSPGIHGAFTLQIALERLLAGAGLTYSFIDTNVVYIYVAGLGSAGEVGAAASTGPGPLMQLNTLHVEVPPRTIGSPRFDDYTALVQAGVGRVLEREPAAKGRAWAVVAVLQLKADGEVLSAKLEDTTGDSKVDAILVAMLAAIHLPAPPPRLPQPIRVRIQAAVR
jgi:hypothetical protein